MIRVNLLLLGALSLSACGQGDRLSPLEGLAPPPGVSRAQAVDGLVVGHRLMEAGEYELALREYLRAGGDHGMTADVLSALGSANLRLGRLGQAEDLLRQAIKKDERYAAAWNNLGVVLMEQGKTGEASRVFKTAFALDSGESAEIRENLRRSVALLHNPAYTDENSSDRHLRRGGTAQWVLSTDSGI